MIITEMAIVTPIKDLKAYLDPERVEKLIAVAPHIRDKLLVRIPWRTGIRVSELIRLRIQDIDFENRAITIIVQKQRKKDGKVIERRRVVPIDQGTLDMIKEYLEWRKQAPYDGELLFPFTRQRVNQIYLVLGKKAGIKEVGDPAISQRRHLHPHHIRHSFAVRSIKKGMSILDLQRILGHQSINTTMAYLQFSVEDLHKGYDKVWEDEPTGQGEENSEKVGSEA
jgi:integrase/recombinase XerD